MKRANGQAQRCPICKSIQSVQAVRCPQCGATLSGTPVDLSSSQPIRVPRRGRASRIDNPGVAAWEADETDLHTGALPASALPLLILGAVLILILVGGGLYTLARRNAEGITPTFAENAEGAIVEVRSGTPRFVITGQAPPTNTRIAALVPTLALPTVTLPPPTPTITPTRGPCIQTARPQDTVLQMAIRCGHKHMAVIDQILQINNLKSASDLKQGQKLEIPWPTPTGGAGGASSAAESTTGATAAPNADTLGQEPTLSPSLKWYVVKKGDTAVSVVYANKITMRILRDLNPEVRFDGCDYGLPAGGPACIVNLAEGQRLRVPASTPTPTKPPTPTGSETPTPTATPTFNAPISSSPDNNMLYETFELPTLRWTATGQLAANETYLLTVTDTTANVKYYHTTRELSFQLPTEWQPTDGKRHVFEWKVNIAMLTADNKAIVTDVATETRNFTWIGR